MRYSLIATALATLSFASPVPGSALAPTPAAFKIIGTTYGGTGCPQGSIDVEWVNNRMLPIEFGPDFTAAVGPGVNITEERKDCQINLDLTYSSGYSFAILNADYSGWGDVDAGVTGDITTTYYFSGDTAQSVSDCTLPGPFTGAWEKRDEIALLVWSPCGGEALLNLKAAVRLSPDGGPASGLLSATHEDAKFTSQLNFLWRQC